MIIDDLNIVGMAGAPNKAEAPLRVDANAVLTCARAFQSFQPISGRNAQAVKNRRGIQHQQLAKCRPLHIRAELSRPFPTEQRFGIPAVERLDHDIT